VEAKNPEYFKCGYNTTRHRNILCDPEQAAHWQKAGVNLAISVDTDLLRAAQQALLSF